MAAAAPGGGYDLLFECPVGDLGSDLHLGPPTEAPLALRELPYALVDVTA